MNTLADAVPGAAPQAPARPLARSAPVWPLYWQMRRELWEHRSLWVAPTAVAGLALLGLLVGAAHLANVQAHMTLNTSGDAAVVSAAPYALSAIAIMATGFIVAVTYCLGALHHERRDRSILFWKSMPVSDVAATGVKAAVPLLVLPAILFGVIVVTQLLMMALNAVFLLPSGGRFATLWAQWPIFSQTLVLAWALVSQTLWLAPVWGWLLMVSAWARRGPFLWAVLPPLGLCLVEMMAFGAGHVAHFLSHRLGGGFDLAFSNGAPHSHMVDASQIDPGQFFGSLDVWGGLLAAAAFFAVTVWLRRTRDPA
jgi:ABC-2 type transport system permease protein